MMIIAFFPISLYVNKIQTMLEHDEILQLMKLVVVLFLILHQYHLQYLVVYVVQHLVHHLVHVLHHQLQVILFRNI